MGKWISQAHVCPVPSVFGWIPNPVDSVWQDDCGQQWQVQANPSGGKRWVRLGLPVLSRREVLDDLADKLLPASAGPDEAAQWRTTVHGVLERLERLGLARWNLPQDSEDEPRVPPVQPGSDVGR